MALLLICIVFLLSLVGCSDKYNEDDFIGKTSAQIVEEFGQFDCILMHMSSDGLYRNTACGYTIVEAGGGLFGEEPEELIFICFDENGVAYKTYEDYRPGG